MSRPNPVSSPGKKKEGIYRYGGVWPAAYNFLDIELTAFRYAKPTGGRFQVKDVEGVVTFLPKAQHFKNVVGALWPERLGNKPNPKYFEFHPWADRMLEAACANNFLGVAGCASSGKTRLFAMWALVNYICAPAETLVIVVSTSLKDARERIWGAIEEYWLACPGLPGKLVSSMGRVRYEVPGLDAGTEALAGITLIAGDKSKSKEAAANLIGKKNRRVILIADEHTELSEAINEAAFGNLKQNPWFQFIGIGNPKSHYDAFGVFIQPLAGWDSIHAEMDEWPTKWGLCIRLDGLKCPNWVAGRNLFRYLIKVEDINEALKNFGANSPIFWRMYRGFFCPVGDEQTLFSEADVIQFGGGDGVVWLDEPLDLAALDPAHKTGGDESALYFGKYGVEASSRNKVLLLTECVSLREDVTKKDVPMNFQIAHQFRDECKKRGIPPEQAALDATNIPFADIVSSVWSPRVWRTCFGGKATERPLSDFTDEPASSRCSNRVSEIWLAGLELLKHRQLRGMDPALVQELCSRHVDTSKNGGLKLTVESKRQMKSRIGRSPDKSDAAMILVDLIRERFRGSNLKKRGTSPFVGGWRKLAQRFNVSASREMS